MVAKSERKLIEGYNIKQIIGDLSNRLMDLERSTWHSLSPGRKFSINHHEKFNPGKHYIF